MTTNRNLLNNSEIIKIVGILSKGLPLPFLEGKYVVNQGWCAVITEGGAFKEILQPGTYFLGHYHMFRDVKATEIDMRMKTLTVSTLREFSIAQPLPIEINLDLAVEFRVADPQRVATEITTPLTSLFDRVIQAVRGSVVNAHVDEIRTQGEGIARSTLQRLHAMQLPSTIGLEVLNVLTTSIKATDAGSDALAQLQMSEFTKVQDWRVDNAILSQSKITPEWLMVNRPELYAQIMSGNKDIILGMVDKGMLDPAGFLNQPTTAAAYNPFDLLSGFGVMGIPGMPGLNPGQPSQSSASTNGQNNPLLSSGKQDIHSRIREELTYLEKMAGIKIDSKPGMDGRGIPDGSYNLCVSIPRNSGGDIILYFACQADYPTVVPFMEVEVNGEATPFQSATLRRWNGQYLVEIVREVKQYFG